MGTAGRGRPIRPRRGTLAASKVRQIARAKPATLEVTGAPEALNHRGQVAGWEGMGGV